MQTYSCTNCNFWSNTKYGYFNMINLFATPHLTSLWIFLRAHSQNAATIVDAMPQNPSDTTTGEEMCKTMKGNAHHGSPSMPDKLWFVG